MSVIVGRALPDAPRWPQTGCIDASSMRCNEAGPDQRSARPEMRPGVVRCSAIPPHVDTAVSTPLVRNGPRTSRCDGR